MWILSFLHSVTTWEFGFRICSNLQDFDNKLTEADAYLQILSVEAFGRANFKTAETMNREKKTETLKETTNSLVESIKHCIVSLQIAKSTINPVDAIY